MTAQPIADASALSSTPFVVSRRSMLRGLGITGLGAAFAPLFARSGPAAAAPPKAGPTTGKRLGASVAQPTPYLVQASTELTEEVFMTSEVLIKSGDYVYPFVNPKNGNQVEALVFASGTLSHLRRDATTPTGWSFSQFDLQGVFTTVNDVAVAANGTDVYVLVFGTPDPDGNPADAPAWLTRLDGPTSWESGALATYEDLGIDGTAEQGVVKGGVSREGVPYFSTVFVDKTSTTLGGWVATGDMTYQPLAYQKYLQLDTTSDSVQDFSILYDTKTSNPATPTGFAVVLMSSKDLNVYAQDGVTFDTSPMQNAGTTGVTELMWAWYPTNATTGTPGYAFQTTAGTGFVDENGNYNTVADVALGDADNAVAVWQLDDLYTVNLLDKDGTLQMIQELSSGGTGSWATPIPLVPDLQAVYGVPTDPNENTLFVVGLDETLSVLSLGPTGWTQTQIHQAGEEAYDFAAYRVMATVTDANGTAVPTTGVTISTDRPVGAWTPDGSLAITPDAPLAFTTDYAGRVTFSVPAEELDCAMLSLQALDASGKASGESFTIVPDTDVRGFLGGTGTLSDLGSLNASTLAGATQSGTSTLLFPTLTDTSSAGAAVSVFNQMIKTGTDAQNSNTATGEAFKLDLTSGKPTYQSPPPASAAKLQGTHLEFSFSHLWDSIGHAIRHGAMKLATVVVKLADDAKSWVVDLALKIGDDIVNFTDLVISDMKSAFHVIGGFFATLGADIKAAVEWLKHDVLALIAGSKSAAGQLQTWFVDLGTGLTTTLKGIEVDTDNWFSAKEKQAHDEIQALMPKVEGDLGGPTLPSPSGSSGSSGDEAALAKDLSYLGKVINDLPGVWLMHKFESYLPATDTAPTVDQSTYQPLLTQLGTDWAKAMTFSDDLATFVSTTMTDAFSSNGKADQNKLSNTQVTTWFTDLDGVVDSGLQLLDAIADTVLQVCITGVELVEDYFTHQYNVIGSLGILGWIFEKVGVDLKFSISEITSWAVAFPATLVAMCRGYNGLFPSSVSASHAKPVGRRAHGGRAALGGKDPDGWQVGLGIVGAVAQAIWGFADLVGDLQQFADPDSGERGKASGIIDYFDIVCPLVETVALWPSEPNSDGSASYPFHGGIATGTTDFELLPFVIWSAILPSVMGAVVKAEWTEDLSTSGFPAGVQDIAKDYMSPFVQMIAGVVNTILGAVYSSKNDAGWVAILGTVLGNLSFVGAPLLTKLMAATTDDISVLVKMAIDAAGNIGAAVCIAEATSLPTP